MTLVNKKNTKLGEQKWKKNILSEDPANYTEGLIFEDETKALSAYANHQEYGKQSYLFEFHHPDEDSKSPPTAIFAWKSLIEKVRIL